jgi:predicted CoA-binding protein
MSDQHGRTVAVLGASPKPDRYAYRAMQMLRVHGYRPVPINPAYGNVLGEKCYRSIVDVPAKIDTVTLYLGKARSGPLADDIVSVKPRRIIMNPGAENNELAAKARTHGIEVVEDCTLVMLGSGSF